MSCHKSSKKSGTKQPANYSLQLLHVIIFWTSILGNIN